MLHDLGSALDFVVKRVQDARLRHAARVEVHHCLISSPAEVRAAEESLAAAARLQKDVVTRYVCFSFYYHSGPTQNYNLLLGMKDEMFPLSHHHVFFLERVQFLPRLARSQSKEDLLGAKLTTLFSICFMTQRNRGFMITTKCGRSDMVS